MIVRLELEKIGIGFTSLSLGEVDLVEKPSSPKYEELQAALQKWDFELMNDRITILVEKIKTVIIEMVHFSNEFPKTNHSDYISKKLFQNYTYLSAVFSEMENITIEHFIISHKVEKVKELLMYGEKSITEIADMLDYSSAAHLSNQFKKVTGFTPTFFKAMQNKNRISLENI